MPETEPARSITSVLPDIDPITIGVMGEHAEGIFGAAHVEYVESDVGFTLFYKTARQAVLHVVGAVEFSSAVDVTEYGLVVEDAIPVYCLPAVDFCRQSSLKIGNGIRLSICSCYHCKRSDQQTEQTRYQPAPPAG